MKKRNLAVLFVLVGLLFVACAPKPTPRVLRETVEVTRVVVVTATPPPTEKERLTKAGVPLWSAEDFEDTMKGLENPVVGKVFMNDPETRPPYYKDPQPLSYLAYHDRWLLNSGTFVTLAYDFGEFQNYFLYGLSMSKVSGIAEGALTIDTSGQHRLAEARFLRFLKGKNGKLSGVEIEEFHYDLVGELIFTCKSQIDIFGFKVGETETVGTKERDYYFIWPVGP